MSGNGRPSLRPMPTDRALLAHIANYQADHGYAPSVRDLVTLAGLSSTSVCAYRLAHLQARGLIERDVKVSRSIRITGEGEAWL